MAVSPDAAVVTAWLGWFGAIVSPWAGSGYSPAVPDHVRPRPDDQTRSAISIGVPPMRQRNQLL
ncbi:MAG TPA: hypothetical protein VGP26_16930 [Actinophytocola sp.]|jgi:hypothetical protein|nr:hypothetical protein [Actinophytocola sp.]